MKKDPGDRIERDKLDRCAKHTRAAARRKGVRMTWREARLRARVWLSTDVRATLAELDVGARDKT